MHRSELPLNIRNLAIIGILAAVVLAAAGGAGWWFFIRDDAKPLTNAPAIPADLVKSPTARAGATAAATSGASTPAAGATTAFGTPGAAAATALAAAVPTIGADASGSNTGTTFAILSDRSEAAYYADEKLASLPVPSTAKGSTTGVTGSFHLNADGGALDPSQPSSFTVDLTTLKSDKDMRDRRVQNTLETSKYPTATFTVSSVTGFSPTVAAGDEQSLKLTGILDLHGVKKEITWDVKARKLGNVITAIATVTFAFEDFNLSPPNIGGFVSVQDHITLQMVIVAQAS
jgi:polyisoprenoid-binding protein YceI